MLKITIVKGLTYLNECENVIITLALVDSDMFDVVAGDDSKDGE